MRRLTFFVLTAVSVLPATAFADWPLSRGDARMSGVGSAKLPDQLAERWVFKCKDSVESAPAVADGLVFVSCLDKNLYALDLATGEKKWQVELGPMKASPAVDGGRVYVGSLDGKFHAVEAKTGKKLWSFEAGGEIHAGANFYKGNVFFGCHDATLYCLKPDGTKAWALQIDGPINAAAPVVGDFTFVTGCSDGMLYVVDLKEGKSLGTVDLAGQSVSTAAVTDDKVFLTMVTNQVVAVDWKARKKAWEFEAKRRQQPFYSSPAVTDKMVIAGSKDRKVYALDRETGAEKWNFVTEGAVDASPVVVGNRVYVGCVATTGEFYVLDLDGKQVQQIVLDSAVTGSVGVGPDCILVGTDKGSVYCLGK